MKKVNFKSCKREAKKVRVSFLSSKGERISFTKIKKNPKRVHLRFLRIYY